MSLSLYDTPALGEYGLPYQMQLTDVMETRALPVPEPQEMADTIDVPRPSFRVAQSVSGMNGGGTGGAVGTDYSALRAGRYQEAEARLLQCFRHCRNEPSAHQLKIRALERAALLLSQLAQESGNQAMQLAAMTADRTAIASSDPGSYRLMLSQRWRAEKRQDFISRYMKITKQTVASLSHDFPPIFIASDAELAPLPARKHEEGHVLDLEDKSATNLMTFLCCSQRVVSLHPRSHSRSLNIYLRPLTLNTASTISSTMPISPTTTPLAARTNTNSDLSLTMHVESPPAAVPSTESLAQLKLQTAGEEIGTAIILSPRLPPAAPLDPSSIKVELPHYVYDLLADFDANGNTLPAASATIKSQNSDNSSSSPIRASPSPFFSPLRYLRRERGPRSVKSHPNLHSKSSLKRLSGILSMSETLTSQKVDSKRGDGSRTTLTTISEAELCGDSRPPAHSRALSSSSMIGKVVTKVGHRISFVGSKR